MRAALGAASAVADVVELRIDLLDEPEQAHLPRLLAGRPCPVIVTCRAVREGGRWPGDEATRLDVLRAAIDLGAEYVDVEADAVHQIRDRGVSRLIASSHDFAGLPADVPGRWRALAETGADAVKIVGMARGTVEIVPLMEALAAADRPTVAIAMGEAGLASRVLALRYPACLLTFCALETGGGTAPGQISAADLVSVYRARSLRPATAVVGLVGPSADHVAVARWNRVLREGGHDAVAVPLVVGDADSLAASLDRLRPLGIRGYVVDPAFQEVVGQSLDGLDRRACRVGAVNLVSIDGDRLVGAWVERDEDAVSVLVGAAVG
jgi:3-dehydroquinate dehydratase/shikimate dehydrogenase